MLEQYNISKIASFLLRHQNICSNCFMLVIKKRRIIHWNGALTLLPTALSKTRFGAYPTLVKNAAQRCRAKMEFNWCLTIVIPLIPLLLLSYLQIYLEHRGVPTRKCTQWSIVSFSSLSVKAAEGNGRQHLPLRSHSFSFRCNKLITFLK